MKSAKLTVEIWSDVICPWCWIGTTRFDRAMAGFAHAEDVEVIHNAFRLMPGQTPSAVEAMLSKKLGMPLAQVPVTLDQIEQIAASEGLTYRLGGTFVGDTLDAHRLIKLAETQSKGRQAVERFFRGYFSEHASVFERQSLLTLAVEAGLDRQDGEAVLDGGCFRAEVENDQRRVQVLSGNGVPFFLIGGQYAVSGAQRPEVFIHALAQGWANRPAPVLMIGDGATCGPEGCAVPKLDNL
jgi:predicted DsbA family dithiol-disulfide isomerase